MSILLVIIGFIGWIVSVNGWFIIPTILWKGCLVVGLVILAIQFLVSVFIGNKVKSHFKHFDKW